jgi:hypothetical protein
MCFIFFFLHENQLFLAFPAQVDELIGKGSYYNQFILIFRCETKLNYVKQEQGVFLVRRTAAANPCVR